MPRREDDLAAGRFDPICPRCGGPLEPIAITEDARLDPRSVYAATKVHQEHLAFIAMREGGNRDTVGIRECCRVARVIGYDRDIFLDSRADFTNSTVMDDFEVTLALLCRGYPNGVLNTYAQNQKSSNAPGGASLYRTLGMHKAAAEKLASRYPQFVRTVEKTTKTAWNGATRTDVIVQWKKALESAMEF